MGTSVVPGVAVGAGVAGAVVAAGAEVAADALAGGAAVLVAAVLVAVVLVAVLAADDVPGPQADSASPAARPSAARLAILVVRVKCREFTVVFPCLLVDQP
jgi:hypothetical protein